MPGVRMPTPFAFALALFIPMAARAAPAEYIRFTTADSANLAASVIERFLWKSGMECPYTVIRPSDGPVKGFMMLLHGAGDNATNFSKIAGRLALQGMVYIVPRAPFATTVRIPDREADRVDTFAGFTWLDAAGSPWHDRGAAFSTFLVGQAVERELPAATGLPLIVAGYRQGAGIAALWAAFHPGRVKGLVLVSGYAEGSVTDALGSRGLHLRGIPCLALIGTDSPDAVDSGDLAVRVRDMGARVEAHFLDRHVEPGDDDYGFIRAFVQQCMQAVVAPDQLPTP